MTHDRTPDPSRPAGSAWQRLVSSVLGLRPEHVAALRAALRSGLAVRSCSGTFREARGWARRHRVPRDALETGLRGLGARCDCEALRLLERP